ncbi:MAG: hypothetical protein WBS19_08435, partial [Candidatus Korobacteraceae bacterium]
IEAVWLLFLVLALTLLTGCSVSGPPIPAPLSASNINLIFVVSEDLAYHATGDFNPKTANLTNQGLQRSLLMATFLKQQVMAGENVSAIYALEPMTHLQTASNYPDMVALETIQQFALLNQITLSSDAQGGTPYAGQSFPINASYASGPLPSGVPAQFCPNCQGLDFDDEDGDNEALVTGIVNSHAMGFYVFSAPWETTNALLANINKLQGYNLALPPSYRSPNYIYVISISPSGSASMITYSSNLNPPSSYPVLPPPPLVSTACTAQAPFSITVTGGQGGALIPAGINTNETIYIIRHADAHPLEYWDDNNYVGAGQWRALDLPNSLHGKISPDQVYSIDPAQFGPGSVDRATGDSNWSTVAPSLTAAPYAIANNLPYHLFSSFLLTDQNAPTETSTLLFTGGTLSNHKVLLAWAYQFIQPTINALLATYHGSGPPAPPWPDTDYDTIWTVKLDAVGNLTVSNAMCEGINSAALPATPPQF